MARFILPATHPKYKWYILALGMMTFFTVAGLSRLCMPVLFKQISTDLDLGMVAIGTIWGMDPLAGIAVALPGGMLVDRFGVRATLSVVCLFAGIFGALRGLSFNFATMAGSMFLFGVMAATAPSIVPKAAGIWFNGKQLGLANALLNITWAVGSMTATMLSATVFAVWLGGWRPVLFAMGVPCIIMAALWLTIDEAKSRDGAGRRVAAGVGLRQALFHVSRIKSVWLLGLIGLCNFGAGMAMLGYLPLYLRNIGWSPALADGAMTLTNGVSMLGILPMVMLANRLRSPKTVLFLTTVIITATLVLLPLVNGPAIWAVVFVNGFLRSSTFTLLTVIIFEMKTVGPNYSGTALGLMNSVGMIGAFLSPPIGNSLAGIAPGAPFFFWAALAALSLPIFFSLKTERHPG